MKTKLELYKAADAVAETLIGETVPKKIDDTIHDAFGKLQLADADWPGFGQFVRMAKARFESLQRQLTETEKLAQKEAKKTAAPAPAAN